MRNASLPGMGVIAMGVLLLMACGGTKGGDTTRQSRYTSDVGTATTLDFTDITNRLLTKRSYRIDRYEEYGDNLVMETEWQDRSPFEDELQIGVVRARSRFVIQARPRIRSGGETKINRVQFTGENLVKFEDGGTWIAAPLTRMARAYFKDFATQLKDEYRTRTRRY